MLISDIIAEIMNEVGADSTDTVLSAKMLGFFKAGIRRLPAFCRDRNFLGEGTITITVGSRSGNLDSLTGFIREREVWFVGDNGIHIPIYKPPSTMYWHKVITPNASGKPFYYRIYGRAIEIDKKADSALTVGVDYFKAVSAVAASDTWLPDEQILEAAKHFIKMVYFSDYEEDTEKARENERKGKELAQILEEEYEAQELGGYVDEKY